MFDDIVVGVDFREGGREAIALAESLASTRAKLTLTHVVTNDPSFFRGVSTAYAAAERARCLEQLEREHDLASAPTPPGGFAALDREFRLRCLFAKSAGRGLHHAAEAGHADLIVVGSSRRGLLGRVLVGDETHAALDGAPSAVAIAPAGYVGNSGCFRRIGVGYDGSPESAHAVQVARELAAEHGGGLSGLTAIAVPTAAFGPGALPMFEAIEALRSRARDELTALGGLEAHVAYGAHAEELAAFSAHVDLLVVGSRGYGPLGRLVHGSTSRQLARSARCPLLVLTRTGGQSNATEPESRSDEDTAQEEPPLMSRSRPKGV